MPPHFGRNGKRAYSICVVPRNTRAFRRGFCFGSAAGPPCFPPPSCFPCTQRAADAGVFPMLWTYLGATLILLVIGRLAAGLAVRLLQARANTRRQALEFAQFEANLALLREQRRQLEDTPLSWSGFRKFVVRRKVQECANVYSFFLSPHDTKPLPAFKPGQYLTFRLPNPLGGGPVVRCYSLSDRPHEDYYRVTVKRVGADSPGG